jgi:hypothetical protein
MRRKWRRVTMDPVKWFPDTLIGPCHRGALVVRDEARNMFGAYNRHREYTVHSRPTGRFGIEHEWSMK